MKGQSRVSLGLVALMLALVLTACLPSQWDYLVEATGQATQEDVRERFGAPRRSQDLEDGGSLWVYRYNVRSSLAGMRGDMMGGAPCIEYFLTFDRAKVLIYWTRQPCGMENPTSPGIMTVSFRERAERMWIQQQPGERVRGAIVSVMHG
jgi:hypothetical protein